MNQRFLLIIFCAVLQTTFLSAQDQGVFSGGFQSNANFFIRDSLIGAANIPQYDFQLFGAEAWLDLGYSYKGYRVGVRFDLFNNSNLFDPNNSYSDQGIGKWYIQKQMEKLGIQVGYVYNQIGSGIIYRAYEERPQLIDNALVGAQVTYSINDNWVATGFSGRQRNLFSTWPSIVKGGKLEGFISLNTGTEEAPKFINFAPGIGILNRTLDDETMNKVIGIVKNYVGDERFKPEYNAYAFTLYNTMTFGPISWFVEGAYKTEDTFRDPFALKTEINGAQTIGRYQKLSGNVVYTSLSYAKNKLGITLEGKRTENFNFRADPTLTRNFGQINFLPPMNRQNTYRLTTRYSPATQDLSEMAVQADVKYRFSKAFNINLNFSNITDLDGDLQLYREFYVQGQYKYKRLWQLIAGLQRQEYNQEIYEVKPGVPILENYVAFTDFLYKFTRKKSVRAELQYMIVGDDEKAGFKQDYGDWAFGLIEFNIPHWSFVVSDMYNLDPGKNAPSDSNGEKLDIHYPRVDVFYTNKSNRYGLSYVKQVEGIVCTGGICRLEPAFSGFKFSINSTF